jgi:hypothetical protein
MKRPSPLKITICTLAVLIPGSVLAAWLYFVSSLERDFQVFMDSYPRLNIEYADLRTNPLKKQLTLDQPRITYDRDTEINAREINFEDLVINEGLPVQMTVRIMDMDIKSLSRPPAFFRDLEHSGSRPAGINGILKYEYSPEAYTLRVHRIAMQGMDLGLICSSFTLSSLNARYILSLENPFLLIAALLGVRIDYFEAGYEDLGMIKRMARQGTLRADDKNGPGWKSVLDELFRGRDNPVDSFLGKQEPLTIKIIPQNPVPFSVVLTSRSITDAADVLGLDISNQSPDFCHSPDMK